MTLTRDSRQDRRRRSMREAIAAESGVAVEAVRARARRRSEETEGEQTPITRKDPGYSQEVRYACQQRLVQLIPVRKATMLSVIAALGSIWAALMFAHYLVNVRGTALSNLAIAHFFHIRSPHSVAHWLGVQLWMFTAIVSLLIYQLRRHKLDDYRAKYRIWLFLAVAAAFCSFDASTSALYIIGSTIDPWTQQQFNLAGWPVVLGSFAALVGVLGLRLCTELKSSPGSVSLWLAGMFSWAYSAVLGTGLFKTDMSPAVLDMVVGASWLGGILAVFLGATLYLRHIYIQAQKRFALRNKWLAEQQKWHIPKLSLDKLNPRNMASGLTSKLRRKQLKTDAKDSEQSVAPKKTQFSDPRAHSQATGNAFVVDSQATTKPQSSTSTSKPEQRPAMATAALASNRSASKIESDEEVEFNSAEPESKASRRSWLPWGKKESATANAISDEYSDVGISPRVRDKGLNSGFEKVVAGEPNREPKEQPQATSNTQNNVKTKRSWNPFARSSKENASSAAASKTAKETNRTNVAVVAGADAEPEKKRSWSIPVFKRSAKPKQPKEASQPNESAEGLGKKRGFFSRPQTPATASTNTAKSASNPPAGERKKSRWFGFMDALTLKPPVIEDAKSSKPQSQVSIPSTSKPPAQTSIPVSSQASSSIQDDDDDDAGEYRHLSKAERKRLRRQQQQNRAA